MQKKKKPDAAVQKQRHVREDTSAVESTTEAAQPQSTKKKPPHSKPVISKKPAEKANSKGQRTGVKILAIIAIILVLILLLRFVVLSPLLNNWQEVDSMTGNTWLEDNAQQVQLETNPSETTSESELQEDLYESISMEQSEIHNGDLILVNNSYAYESTDEDELTTVYGNKSDSYYVSGSELMLRSEVIDNLNTMLDDFRTATGHEDMIIISGYRTTEQQQELYDEDLESTGASESTRVAKPGYSEHETGYAFDFSLFDGINSSDYDGTGEYAWINENCAHYGFVLRFPEDKTDLTEIQYESWHYRYVGQPHAYYMQKNNLCLEEYVENLKDYTIDQPLEITNWDGKVYQVYYVPAESGDSTYVMVPSDVEYTISGNNIDGFIVTVDTGVTNLDAVSEEETEDTTEDESSNSTSDSEEDSNSENSEETTTETTTEETE